MLHRLCIANGVGGGYISGSATVPVLETRVIVRVVFLTVAMGRNWREDLRAEFEDTTQLFADFRYKTFRCIQHSNCPVLL